jgi:hypothetical protein
MVCGQFLSSHLIEKYDCFRYILMSYKISGGLYISMMIGYSIIQEAGATVGIEAI